MDHVSESVRATEGPMLRRATGRQLDEALDALERSFTSAGGELGDD